MTGARVVIVVVLSAALPGCPGGVDVTVTRDSGADAYWTPTPDSSALPDQDSGYPFPKELGRSDATLDKAPGSTPGGPCPCKSPLVCVATLCRRPCIKLACNGPASGCGVTESCMVTSTATVCIPGAGKGKPCGASAPCQSGLLCLSTSSSSSSGTCFTTCNATGTCAGGSTCYTSPTSGCKYCFP